jgi:hypothetical protein
LLVIVVCLAAWQGWLTWRLTEQEHRLAEQRARERLEQRADLAVAQLSIIVSGWDLALREMGSVPSAAALPSRRPAGGILIVIDSHRVTTDPRQPLLFVPTTPVGHIRAEPPFESAARLEFHDQQYEQAVAV